MGTGRPVWGIVTNMTTASALDTARRIAAPVGMLGGGFMLDPSVLGAGKEAGYPNGFVYYVVGRGGVLGDVHADVVVSAFGFFAPDLVSKMWNAQIEGPRAAADRYTAGCQEWGRTRLAGWNGADRLADLLSTVVDQADPTGLALFAGWRAQARPTDAVGRCYQLLHVLRELRGCVHIVAVLASGLTPLQAVLSNPTGGPETAQRFGWTGDLPNVDRPAFENAENLTNSLMAGHLSVLDANELAELGDLVAAASSHVFGQ